MTRAAPELAPPLQTSEPHHREGATDPIHDGSLMESGFEPGALRLGGRQFSTKPKRTHFSLKRYKKKKKKGIESVILSQKKLCQDPLTWVTKVSLF
ncbi:hypothetical protein AVEN_217134-1 [Araneus ventricosus]|uniref:Uncharacterized protein n=1 Tax=Araneus ventricosus TaxID=182803 RepID=A0A4Y2E6M9_ARAVE|nr:hypothetical protein AVEN_217134-1 [Araneus ventricosus]